MTNGILSSIYTDLCIKIHCAIFLFHIIYNMDNLKQMQILCLYNDTLNTTFYAFSKHELDSVCV